MTDQSCQHDPQFHALTNVSVSTVFVVCVAVVEGGRVATERRKMAHYRS